MVTNAFSPLVSAPYGFTGAAPYNLADVPSRWAANNALSPEQLTKRLAYEWLNSHEIGGNYSNPPFTSGAAGRLHPILQSQRITRGYIRRAQYEKDDATSNSRLYFMFNPETIVRDYVSYLDQAALDPFNTVYGSNNLVAPPSFMNFRFDLFFDRQDEVAQDIDNPGVFADYQFFDLVVRNVIPSDPNAVSTTLPDNGVMMVNPRDITVVFSPQITVQGRPINAQVVFEKFSHRMTPIRMRIALEMRVVYIGPMRKMSEYTMETAITDTSNSVAPDDTPIYTFTNTDLKVADAASAGAITFQPGANGSVQNGLNGVNNLSASSNLEARLGALQWARTRVVPGYTVYDRPRRGSGLDSSGLLRYTDCSGLVWNAYNAIGMTAKLKWGGTVRNPTATDGMIAAFGKGGFDQVFSWNKAGQAQARVFFNDPANRAKVQPGDLLFRDKRIIGTEVGHVVFFVGWTNDGKGLIVFDAASPTANPQVGERSMSLSTLVTRYTHVVRPIPLGSTSYASVASSNPYLGTSYV